jgi:MoxR-like ATPase
MNAQWTDQHEYYLSTAALPIEEQLSKIMVGQKKTIRRVVQGLLAVGQRDFNAQSREKFLGTGHVACEGAVGTGKTVLCKSLACLLAGDSKRVSGMPDALPSDVTGCEIILLTGKSKVVKGPVFCNVMLADEINRYSPKAQTAFIEILAEGTVSIGDQTYQLKRPFFCLATQNPTEQKGTSRMQEALADRFMFKVVLEETTPAEKIAIAQRTRNFKPELLKPIVSTELINQAREFFFDPCNFYVSNAASGCCVKIIQAINHPEEFNLFKEELKLLGNERLFKQKVAINDRGVLHLEGAAMIEAVWNRRAYVLPEDVYEVAADVLRARLIINDASLYLLLDNEDAFYKTETELIK